MEINQVTAQDYFTQITSPEEKQSQTQVNQPQNSVAAILGTPEIKTPENKGADEVPDEGAAQAVQTLADASKGRPKEKLDESTKQAFMQLIENEGLETFDDGKGGIFIPETIKDLQEVLQANKDKWKEDNYKDVEKSFYSSKPPAWQAVYQYAENLRSPEELLPYLTATQEYNTFVNLDVKDPSHQEYIIKSALTLQGLPEQTIQSEIDDLKDRNKLEDRASALKPALDSYAANQLQILQQEQLRKAEEENRYWDNHYQAVAQNIINQKEIGGLKIKDNDRRLIAEQLIPNPEIGGLPIYAIIDNLLSEGKWETLAKLSLLAKDEKAFNNYYDVKAGSQQAAGLQRTLRSVQKTNGGDEGNFQQAPEMKRPGLKRNSGFGYLPK